MPQLEDGYVRISNELLEALAATKMSGNARRVLCVILRQTYGYNKKKAIISGKIFKKMTYLSKSSIFKARTELKENGVIGVSADGNGYALSYYVKKDYTLWKGYPKTDTVSVHGNGGYPSTVTVGIRKRIPHITKDNLKTNIKTGNFSKIDEKEKKFKSQIEEWREEANNNPPQQSLKELYDNSLKKNEKIGSKS